MTLLRRDGVFKGFGGYMRLMLDGGAVLPGWEVLDDARFGGWSGGDDVGGLGGCR